MSVSSSLRRAATTAALLILAATTVSGCGAGTASQPTNAAQGPGWAILSSSDVEQLPLSPEGGTERQGDVLITDGATGFGSTAAPDDFDLTKSFTVAAWVSAQADADPFATALSQVGEVAAGFFLGTAEGVPAFSMKDADTNDEGHTTRAMAEEPMHPDEWVHLAGVFDADKGEISLFIDGKQAAVTPFSAPIRPAGVLTVGRSQSHATPSDFWAGAITEVRIIPAVSSTDEIAKLMTESQPKGSPPEATAADPATYADGQLNGTWDYVLTPDEVAFATAGFTEAERKAAGDVTALRVGFSGSKWWQGFVGGGKVWLVNGVPEGDGGVFTTDGSTIMLDNGSAVETMDWSLADDELHLVLKDCQLGGSTCDDIDIVRFMLERAWTLSSRDPSY